MQAVLDHDADLAVTLITDHINGTAALLERYQAEPPDLAEIRSRVAEIRG
jgi:hypothetical protein